MNNWSESKAYSAVDVFHDWKNNNKTTTTYKQRNNNKQTTTTTSIFIYVNDFFSEVSSLYLGRLQLDLWLWYQNVTLRISSNLVLSYDCVCIWVPALASNGHKQCRMTRERSNRESTNLKAATRGSNDDHRVSLQLQEATLRTVMI